MNQGLSKSVESKLIKLMRKTCLQKARVQLPTKSRTGMTLGTGIHLRDSVKQLSHLTEVDCNALLQCLVWICAHFSCQWYFLPFNFRNPVSQTILWLTDILNSKTDFVTACQSAMVASCQPVRLAQWCMGFQNFICTWIFLSSWLSKPWRAPLRSELWVRRMGCQTCRLPKGRVRCRQTAPECLRSPSRLPCTSPWSEPSSPVWHHFLQSHQTVPSQFPGAFAFAHTVSLWEAFVCRRKPNRPSAW